MPPQIDESVLSNETFASTPRSGGSWWSAIVGAVVAAAVAFVWAMQTSPGGGEGLMGLESFAGRFFPALPKAMALGVVVVLIANKLVSLAPESSPWDPLSPPSDTIDGHYKPAWLAAFATPFVVAPVFGVLPLAILLQWVRVAHVKVWPGDGSGVVTAAAAALLLVPRLARAVMREVDVRVHARRG
jgi:hypothetical protein